MRSQGGMNVNKEFSDSIILKDLKFWGRHGANQGEQDHPQPFLITLNLRLDLEKPCQSDQLEDTLDYSVIYTELKALFENTHYQLLEKLAQEAAAIALKNPLVGAVTVRVEKPRAKTGGDQFAAAVEINRQKSG